MAVPNNNTEEAALDLATPNNNTNKALDLVATTLATPNNNAEEKALDLAAAADKPMETETPATTAIEAPPVGTA